jgi:predicted dehydrogenase
MRKIRIFQQDAYLSIDYAAQKVEVYKKIDSSEQHESPQITYEQINIQQGDSLKEEIKSFLRSVQSRNVPEVPGEQGRNVLKVALEIVEQIEAKKAAMKI